MTEFKLKTRIKNIYFLCFAEQANQQMMMSHQAGQQNQSVVSTPTGEYMPQPFQNIEQGMNRHEKLFGALVQPFLIYFKQIIQISSICISSSQSLRKWDKL